MRFCSAYTAGAACGGRRVSHDSDPAIQEQEIKCDPSTVFLLAVAEAQVGAHERAHYMRAVSLVQSDKGKLLSPLLKSAYPGARSSKGRGRLPRTGHCQRASPFEAHRRERSDPVDRAIRSTARFRVGGSRRRTRSCSRCGLSTPAPGFVPFRRLSCGRTGMQELCQNVTPSWQDVCY